MPSMLAKFSTWLLVCVIACSSVLSGYATTSAGMGNDSSAKFTMGYVVGACMAVGGSGLAYDDCNYDYDGFHSPANGGEQYLDDGMSNIADATSYAYDGTRERYQC